MEKGQIITVLVILSIILASLSGVFYFKIINLTSKILSLTNDKNQLNLQVQSLDSKVNSLTDENSRLNSQINISNRKLSMLDDDLNQIIKGCITDNSCKGHRGSIRFVCDAAGKETDSGSHICVCDENCELKFLS
jgi:peptidoglycan hydrolase CwlO-like protein